MTAFNKAALKDLLGELPLTAELYFHLRQSSQPIEPGFSLDRLAAHLPGWVSAAQAAAAGAPPGRHLLVFGTLRYWIEHTTLLACAFAGLGHRVSYAFLPYANWKTPLSRFDRRRQNAYARSVLSEAEPLLAVHSLLDPPPRDLPDALREAVETVAYQDTQYSLQMEAVDRESDLYRLRLQRDRGLAASALDWLQAHRPDVVVVPNGSILEFGALYQTARHLEIPTVTYEFGEQRQRVWLAQNENVMHQNTNALWAARRDRPLSEAEWETVRALFAARQGADLWENFARRWQGVPAEGGERIRQTLGLDDRPIVLLATNVIGDSLTLGRQTFSASMSEWVEATVRHFADRGDAQLVVRVHPGEQITSGPSVADLIRSALPAPPENVHLIPADAEVNTYDLMEVADLGLVYTTTVGLEMAMNGTPVIVAGETHYRGKGFTIDPDSWDAYWTALSDALTGLQGPQSTEEQARLAWAYAYRFFFEYPLPFPWRLLNMWEALEEWPLDRVLSPQGQAAFGETFRYLAGEPLDWSARPPVAPGGAGP